MDINRSNESINNTSKCNDNLVFKFNSTQNNDDNYESVSLFSKPENESIEPSYKSETTSAVTKSNTERNVLLDKRTQNNRKSEDGTKNIDTVINLFLKSEPTSTPILEDSPELLHNNVISEKGQYNDYINQAYSDISRRPSIQETLPSNTFWIKSNSSINTNHIVKSNIDDKLKSPSSQSLDDEKKGLEKDSTKKCLNAYIISDSNNPTARTSNLLTPDRPILHVQFVGDELSTSINNNTNRFNCKSSDFISINENSTSNSSETSSSDDEDCSLGQYSQSRAPDGGWGWVVVFASFMVNLIADGITFSFGVIFVEFLNYFEESKGKTAWIGSLFMAIPLLSGPIASFLTDRYGCRSCTIAGSILSCIGFVISAFSNSMELLFLTFGIIAGFGLSLCYVSAVVIVAYYFEKKRSFATGLSVCGSGIGTFIFAPLIQLLLEEYGWRGTTIILAGCFLNMTVCGLLMKDLEWTTHKAKLRAKEKKKKKVRLSADSFSFSNSTNTAGTTSTAHQQQPSGQSSRNEDIKLENFEDPRLFSSLVTLPTFIRNDEKVPPEVLELLSSHKNVHHILHNYPNLNHSRSFSEPYSDNVIALKNNIKEAALKTSSDAKSTKEGKIKISQHNEHYHRHQPSAAYLKDLRIHRHSLTYRGAMLNINRYRLRASSCPDIYRNSMTTIAKEKTQWYQGIDEFKNLFVDILDFSYFSDLKFLLFSISNFLLYTWYDVPYVYLTDNAIEMGINETDASILISIIGIVNMFGEIFLGWLGDVEGISASVVYAACMGLCGAVTALVPLLNSYTWLCVISGAFGLFIAANYALTSIILVELITIDKFTSAYGLLLLVQGIANLIGPPLAGWLCDVTGSYDLSFYVAGIFIILSGAVLLIVPGLGKYRRYRELKRKNSKTDSPKLPSFECNNSKTKCNGTKILESCYEKDVLKETSKIINV